MLDIYLYGLVFGRGLNGILDQVVQCALKIYLVSGKRQFLSKGIEFLIEDNDDIDVLLVGDISKGPADLGYYFHEVEPFLQRII